MGKIGFIKETVNESNKNSEREGLRLKKLEVEFINVEVKVAPKNIIEVKEVVKPKEVKKAKKNRVNRKIVNILVENGVNEKYAKEISRDKKESERFLKLIEDKKESKLEIGSKIIKSRFTVREEEEDRLIFLDERMDNLNLELSNIISRIERPVTNENLINNILNNKPIIVDEDFKKEMNNIKSMLHEYQEIIQEVLDIQSKIDKNKILINVEERKIFLKMYELAVKKFE